MKAKTELLFVEPLIHPKGNMFRIALLCESRDDLLVIVSRIEDNELQSHIFFSGYDAQEHSMVLCRHSGTPETVPVKSITVIGHRDHHAAEVAAYILSLIN